MNIKTETNRYHETLQHIESVESIVARDHTQDELQAAVQSLFDQLESGDASVGKVEVALLYQARGRVKDLLCHEVVKTEEHGQTRTILEKIKHMLHPIAAMGKVYNYEPYPPTADKINLGIDWSSLEDNAQLDRFSDFDNASKMDEGIEHRDLPRVAFWRIPVHKSSLDTKDGKIDFSITKSIRQDKQSRKESDSIIAQLTNPDFPQDDHERSGIASFALERKDKGDHEEWNMNDRSTSEVYRSQGIAPKTLEFIEDKLKQRSKPQVITAEVAQVDVLIWLIKSGYVGQTPEDQAKIDRVFSGDPDLTLASAPGDEQETFKRQYFIFKKDALFDADGIQRPEIWDDDNYGQPEYYMKSSFRINLKKRLI